MESYIEIIIYFATMVLTWILGYLSKKSTWVNNNLIPIQNLAIGIIVGFVNYIFTKDLAYSLTLVTSSLTAGGAYDIYHGKNKIKEGNEKWEEHCEESIGE